MKLLRLLRLLKLIRYFAHWEDDLGSTQPWKQVAIVIFALFIVIHFNACILFLVSTRRSAQHHRKIGTFIHLALALFVTRPDR